MKEGIHKKLLEWCEKKPDDIAYTFLQKGDQLEENLTYSQLLRNSQALAGALGSCRGEPVLLLLPPGNAYIAALLGCFFAGAIAVPAYPPTGRRMLPRLNGIIKNCNAKIILSSEALRSVCANNDEGAGGGKESGLLRARWIDVEKIISIAGEADGESLKNVCSERAILQYTSGSTADPKGVILTHDNIMANQRMIRDSFGHDERTVGVSWLPPYHDMGLIGCVLQTLFLGVRCVHMSPLRFVESPGRWLKAIAKYKATSSGAPNFAYDLCVEKVSETEKDGLDLSSWRTAFNGSEPVKARTLERFSAAFGPCGFSKRAWFPCYGLAEATLLVSGGHMGSFDRVRVSSESLKDGRLVVAEGSENILELVSSGAPVKQLDVWIAEPHGDGLLGEGHIGEICIRGESISAGYWGEKNRAGERGGDGEPFSTVRTGDLGALVEGRLVVTGRIKELIVIRGKKYYPHDIEETIQSSDACLRKNGGAVFAIEEDNGTRIVAVQEVRRREEAAIDAALVKKAMDLVVETHQLTLDRILLVREGSLPKTSSGKMRRLRCCEVFLENGFTSLAGDDLRHAYEAPVGDIERTISAIWSELLGVDRVGRNDGFFELGGDSVLAFRLIGQLREKGIYIGISSLFASPTLSDLAAASMDAPQSVAVPVNAIPVQAAAIVPEMLPLADITQEEIVRVTKGVPGGSPNVQDIYALSPLQEGLLFHHLASEGGDAYLLSSMLAIDSRERLDGFVGALQSVVDRHDALRTSFAWEELGQPVQVVWRKASLSLVEVQLGSGEPTASLFGEHLDLSRYRMDVRHAPLLHLFVGRDESRGRWLLLCFLHHLAGDHSTLGAIIAEVRAYLHGGAANLPEPVPYRNLVAQTRLGGNTEEQESFFRKMLRDVNEPTAPYGLMEVQGNGDGVAESHMSLGERLSSRLRERSRYLGVSTASLFHLAWGLVLSRLTGRKEAVFGTVLFGRTNRGWDLHRAVGLFINTLPVKSEAGDAGAAESVWAMQRLLGGLLRHEHAPLSMAQRCSGVRAPTPLFTSVLNCRYGDSSGWSDAKEAMAGWEGLELLFSKERTNYPLMVAVDDIEEGFVVTAQVGGGIDPGRICAWMRTAMTSLVEALEEEPERAVRELEVMPEEERKQIVEGWNETQEEYPGEKCVHELFEEQAERRPGAVAVVCGGEEVSYGELNERANRLARRLRKAGVKPDSLVAICVERSVEMVVGLMGVLKAGGAYVPLDPAYPAERLRFMLEDSAPVALLTRGKLPEGLETGGVPVVEIGGTQEEEGGDIERRETGLESSHLAYVIYTSGTTGRPKGVMIEHRSVANRLAWMQNFYDLKESDAVLQKTPVGFDVSVWELFWPLQVGARLILARPEGHKDPSYLVDLIRRENVTTIHFVPSMLHAFLEESRVSTCTSLKRVVCSGEALPSALVGRFYEALPATQLDNLYGPTEATVDVTYWRCAHGALPVSIPIGRPIFNTRLYILDGQGRPCPKGISGEIYVGGVGVGRGYLKRPELTEKRFVKDPFVAKPGARMYRTGDLGRWREDGNIEYLGRSDDQVKIRGFRIELGEIEARLLEQEGVREAAVLAVEGGEGEKRLVAYHVSEEKVGAEELRARLAGVLPGYMVPAAYIRLEALPLTSNGKLDRRALPNPDGDAFVRRAYEAPQGEVEELVAAIWTELLGVEKIGRHDDFFALGGHSLLAVRLVSRMRGELGAEVPIRDLFTRPRLAEFAGGLAGAMRPRLPRVERVEGRGDLVPVSFAQGRLWLLAQIDGASEAYHVPAVLRLRGKLDRVALQRALDRVVKRHESLRTTFELAKGEPQQRIAPAEGGVFALKEAKVGKTGELEHLLAQEARRPFDLELGPLIRGLLVEEEAGSHVLAVTMHHIVSDGWSMGVLVNEFCALYAGYTKGGEDSLPELRIQYPDYAVWQRRWMGAELLEAQAAYWRRKLTGAPVQLDLPADRPRPLVQSFEGAVVPFELGAELGEALRALGRKHGATLFVTLMAGWAVLLARLSGQEEVVVGTPSANRGRREIEGLIGFFVNTLALRVDLAGAPTVGGLLEQVRTLSLEAQSNQDVPFEQVVELINPERSLARSPIFQAVFAWQSNEQGELDLAGLEAELLGAEGAYRGAKFDLTLSLGETGGRIKGELVYSTALFERGTIERWLGHFRTLLGAMAADGGRPVEELPLMSEEERKQIVEGWNETQEEYPGEKCVHELFEEQAERRPGAVAVVCGGEEVSYGELNERANRLARRLRKAGVKPDSLVAICVERSVEMVVGLMGVLKAGGAYVPLDPAYPAERLRFMLEDSAPVALLTREGLLEVLDLDTYEAMTRGLAIVDLGDDLEDGVDSTIKTTEEAGLSLNRLAYVIYTSGSTGTPKGVMIEHRSLHNHLQWYLKETSLCAMDTVLVVTSFTFDLTQRVVWGPLLAGSRLVLSEEGFDPHRIIKEIERRKVTFMNMTPSLFQALAEAGGRESISLLTRVFLGGEPLQSYMSKNLANPWPDFVNNYGPTEATATATCFRLPRGYGSLGNRSVPIGRPIRNVRIYILDEKMRPSPIGVKGEIYISGAGVARGYLKRDDMTAVKFIKDPFVSRPGVRMYRTGDFGRWLADGNVEFLGRNDNQVKIRGFRVELGEIESRMSEHCGVREAAVLAMGADGAEKSLVAYVVPSMDSALPVLQQLRMEKKGLVTDANQYELPNGLRVFHQNRSETEHLYRQIFEDKIYLKHGVTLRANDCVFDVGANIGLFSLFAGQCQKDLTVYAFEPMPPVCQTLRLNAELHGWKGRVLECGIADKPGRDTFHFYPHITVVSNNLKTSEGVRENVRTYLINRQRASSEVVESLLDELLEARLSTKDFDCELKTISGVMRELGVEKIDLLKIDVENGELNVLKGIAEGDWPRIRQVVAEVHDIAGRLGEITGLLESRGFSVRIEQESSLTNTTLNNLYAVRPSSFEEDAITANPAEPKLRWMNRRHLLEDIRLHLSSSLPDHMVPVAYVFLDEFPLTPNGKLDRRALPAPDTESLLRVSYEAPQGEVEELVAAIWTELLGVEKIGRHDDFFALGGHSLLAVRLVSRMREELGMDVPIGDLFTRPRLAEFAGGLAGAMRPRLPRVERVEGRGDLVPVSFAQGRLWLLAQIDGASEAYHVPAVLRLRGKLDRVALQRALDRVVKRHESLRTTFELAKGEPQQRIAPAEGGVFALKEAKVGKTGELEHLLAQEARRPFDLELGPLIRGLLVEEEAGSHVLAVTMHHIVSDGWSMGVLVNEFCALYAGYTKGGEDSLPELRIQYPDYAVWQRRWMGAELLEAQAAYWRRKLTGAPVQLDLPADRPRPLVQSFEGAVVPFELGAELGEALRALGRKHGATLFVTLMAGWAVLLARLSGQEEVVVGTPSANRGRREIEGLIGFFVNTLALRVDLAGAPTVGGLLEQVRTLSLEAQSNQDVPFEQVVELINPERSLARSPIFQAVFAWQSNEQGELDLAGLEAELLGAEGAYRGAKFDLTLSLGETGGRIKGELVYSTALFERGTIERWLGHFRTLLGAMAADGGRPVEELPLMSEEERKQIVEGWNETQEEYPGEKCVHELFEEQAERRPGAVAVVCGGEEVSYGELNERANRLARRLRKAGVKPDSLVAICVERSVEMVVGLMGVLKAGGAYVPLDPAYPAERLRFMLEDSAPVALLTRGKLPEGLETGGVPVVEIGGTQEEEGGDIERRETGLESSHLAYVIYTSGTTGRPKGVMIEHRSVTLLFSSTEKWFQFGPGDVWTLFHSYAFDFSVWELWGALIYGGRLVVVPTNVVHSPEQFYALVCREQVTVLCQTPSAFRQFALARQKSKAPHYLRYVIFGGEALETAALKLWYDFNEEANTTLVNMYGITETTVHVTYRVLSSEDVSRYGGSPIGRPIFNTRLYILDGQGRPCPKGISGEIYVGGVGVGRGYLKRPELTEKRFVKDPFVAKPGARMYRTGDLGRWREDGNIEYLGRSDDQVKIRGFRIELGEIEARLLEQEGVREAAVLAVEGGEGEKRLVAYHVSEEKVGAEELRARLAGVLPGYMVPAAYIRLEALPLTSNGKLDRRALPNPDGDAFVRRAYEAPQGEVEELVAAIWTELLGVEKIGRHDDFFALGGHSLLAVRLVSRMRDRGMHVDVRSVFASSRLADLAAASIDEPFTVNVPPNKIPADAVSITPGMLPLVALTQEEIDRVVEKVPGGVSNVQDIYALSPLQEGLLFHHLASSEGDAYLLSNLLLFDARERLDSFVGALQSVVDRHDVLRTSFAWEGLNGPVQLVWRKAPLVLEEVELEDGKEAADSLRDRFGARRYRMEVRQAPLLRLFAAQDGLKGRWLLLILSHHLIDDQTTIRFLTKEVHAYLLGTEDSLPDPVPYRNLVAQARLGGDRREQESFFRKMLGGIDEPTAPFDLMGVRGDGGGIAETSIELNERLSRRLRESARRLGVSAASLFHLSLGLVLSRLTGRQDPVFGTVLFGRMQGAMGSDRGVGLFVNTLPVKIEVGRASVVESVVSTHRLLGELMRHEHTSLALAQRCSGVAAPTPLFTSLLNCRHSGARPLGSSVEADFIWDGMELLSTEARTNYPLMVAVDDIEEGFVVTAQVGGGIDPGRICAWMRTAMTSLVEALEEEPERAVRELEVMPEEERKQIVEGWNETQEEYPGEKCVHELFEEQAERRPGAVAVVCGGEEVSYGELNERANRLARRLRKAGVKPDSLVAICVERSVEMVVGLMGVLKAGGAYVPLDPAYPAERLRFMLEDSAPVALLTRGKLPEGLETGGVPVVEIGGTQEEEGGDIERRETGLESSHLAYVIYTSGTTGRPKGVMIEHRSLCNYLSWGLKFYAPRNSIVSSSLSFDATITSLYLPLLRGGNITLLRERDEVTGLKENLLNKGGCGLIKLTPAHLDALGESLADGNDVTSAEMFVVGGAALLRKTVETWGLIQPRVRLINEYGPTETVVGCAFYEVSWKEALPATIPIGRPIANTKIYILDKDLRPCSIETTGEIYIGGAGVARGYLKRPELTAERFLGDPFCAEPGARMYRTGDFGRWRVDGTIMFLGRKDDQVKIRGYRIELGEIESVLLSFDGIRTAVVASIDDGENSTLVAYYVAEENVKIAEIKSHLKKYLPETYIPSHLVKLAEIPLTANGKVDRAALPDPRQQASQSCVEPTNETEIAIAKIWKEVLRLDNISVTDNFFALGGHSLNVVTMVARIRKEMNIKITLADVFESPDLRRLATVIYAKGWVSRSGQGRPDEGTVVDI